MNVGGTEEKRAETVVTVLTKSYKRDYDRNRVLNQVLRDIGVNAGSSSLGPVEILASLLVRQGDAKGLTVLREAKRSRGRV